MMDYKLSDIINIAQMEILGVNKQYVYYSLLLLIGLAISITLYFVIVKMVNQQYTYVFIYFLSSVSVILITLYIPISITNDMSIDKLLQMIVLFGYGLACILLVQFIIKRKKSRT